MDRVATNAPTDPVLLPPIGSGPVEILAVEARSAFALSAHERLVETLVTARQPDGLIVQSTNTVVVLATGQHYVDEGGQWRETREEISAVAGGFVAVAGPTRVAWPATLALDTEVMIETADDARFRAGVLGLSYYDTASGRNVMIAEVRETPGAPAAANRLVYADAFDGVRADVVYEIRRAGLAQEVILRERPPGPEAFGLDPATTRLEAVTEFLEAPTPRREARPLRREPKAARRAVLADPDFVDERLIFGEWALEAGQVFADGARAAIAAEGEPFSPEVGVPVAKRWEVVDGRTILLEQVEWPAVAPLLEVLPRQADAVIVPETLLRRAAVERQLPARAQWHASTTGPQSSRRSRGGESVPTAETGHPLRTAVPPRLWAAAPAPHSAPGVVLDWELLQSQANFTFRGDTTYLVTGTVNLSGTTTLEGGTVVKFAPQNSAVRINYSGPLICQTGPYRPAIFTARDDNTVGQVVPDSTGTPSGWYGWFGLYANGAGQSVKLEHLRFNHLYCPIGFNAGTSHAVRHTQIVNAKFGLYTVSQTTPVTVANVLFHNLGMGGQVFYGGGTPTVIAEQVTIRSAVSLHNGVNLTLRNSLLADVATVLTYTGDHTTQLASDAGVFASVGAGANYLAADSPYRAAGTEAINAMLLAELRAWGTTREPAVWTTPITTDTVWEPLIERSAGPPDLGYHYPALDYALSGVSLTNATLTLTNGVAVAVYGASGLTITGAGKLQGEGTPGRLNRLVRHSAVQEQWLPAWAGGTSGTLLKDDASGQSGSEVRLRFTECVVPAAGGYFFNGGARLGRLALTDCELHGGYLNFNTAGTYARVVALTNNVLNRVFFSLGTGADTTLTTYARNNLFRGITSGSLNAASGNAWEWRDNLFDTASLWQYFAGVANGHNAYRNCPRQLTPAGNGNLTLTALNYPEDAWGRGWYASTTPSLVDAGSRTASAAGLYHYTTTPDQTKEANSLMDIGFHYVAFCEGAPCDTDGDMLGDFFEDRDGDGLADAGESDWQDPDTDDDGIPDGEERNGGTDPLNPDTDYDGLLDSLEPHYGMNPLHPDTDGDGWPDGAEVEVAPDLDLYLRSYTLNAMRDFNTSPRPTVLPDAYVTMTWQHNAAGTLYKSGNYSECLPPTPPPPPEAILSEGDDYAWPATGSGTRRYWKITYGNAAKQYDPPVVIDRPPSAEINVPWERCTGFVFPMNPPQFDPPFTGIYQRSASAVVHLKSDAPNWPKPKRSVILRVQAVDKTDGGDLGPSGTGYHLGEPVQGNTGVDIDPEVKDIFIDGQRTDGNGRVLIQLDKVAEKDVTPQMDVPWYWFDMEKALPKAVTLTWSRHPYIDPPTSLQASFDEGARRLARDDDGTGDGSETDDIPIHIEFFIFPAKSQEFPGRFRAEEYLWLNDEEHVNDLLGQTFANFKVVYYMGFWSTTFQSFVEPDALTWFRHPSCILVEDAPSIVAVHEWGHMGGLNDRLDHPEALMYLIWERGEMVEVNAGEALTLLRASYPTWGW